MCALLLGVRANPTHTEAILADSDGRTWGQVEIANAEARSTRELLERAFQEASIDFPGKIPKLTAVMALPGLHSPSLRRAAAETIRSVLPHESRAVLCDELEPLLAGGLGRSSGSLLVSGEQAALARVDDDGVFQRVEEPPDPLGQEGSGLWLGTRTLQLAARLLEGRLAPSARLVATLADHFQRPSLHDVWDTVMAQAPDPVTIIGLANRTITLAEFPEPEPACRALVVRAARRLVELVEAAGLESDPGPITWHGSCMVGALLEEVHRQTPALGWQPPRFGGMDGCLFLARAFAQLGDPEADPIVDDAGPALWKTLRTSTSLNGIS